MRTYSIVLLTLFFSVFASAQELNEAAVVVQKQIAAYNAGNLDDFLATYSDDIVFYEPSMEMSIQGKAHLKEVFGNLFKNYPDLFCFIGQRIVSGNTVIDHEKVRFQKGQPAQEFIVMSKVTNGKIAEVYFLKRPTINY